MMHRPTFWWGLVLALLVLSGCGTTQKVKDWVTGSPREEAPQVRETRWVLVKNPRFEANMAEPEYIWVEDDKIPTTLNSLLFGKNSSLAPADVVAKYGKPPGGGQISPLQGGTQVASRGPAPVPRTTSRSSISEGPPAELTPRGYVIYVDKQRVVVDLTAQDGLKKGSLLSLRRERIRLTHPVTGEYLGDLDEEIGSARVVELRERFSVAEVKEVRAGYQLQAKDRVVVREE